MSTIVHEIESKVIILFFYFTFLIPFGIFARFFIDSLQLHERKGVWHRRPVTPTDLDNARRQG